MRLSLFNWVAFFYIGFRAKQRKWILWGLFYSIPFVLIMLNPNLNNWLGDVTALLTILLGMAGIVHAFKIRKEYLVRLEAVQGNLKGGRATPEYSDREADPKQQADDGMSSEETVSNRLPGKLESVDEGSTHQDLGKQRSAPVDYVRTPGPTNRVLLPYEDLIRVCAEHEGDGYYVDEAIGQKRLNNAHIRFPIPETERVIALIDTSLFRSGKTGLALCKGGVPSRLDSRVLRGPLSARK